MKLTYRPLGDFIHEVDIRNENLSITKLMGVNLNKEMMPSVANIIDTDLTKYKAVTKNQFACKLMSVGRDACLPIALKKDDEPVIISSAYYAFEVNDINEILPEYLFMCFLRPIFDKELWFKTGGDVRGGITWDDFCATKIPYISIEEQRKIVRDYKVIADRIELLKKININLENQAEKIFLNYMNENVLEKTKISKIATLSAGGDTPDDKVEKPDGSHLIPIYSNGTDNDGLFGFTNEAKIIKPSITISARGYIGYTVIHRKPYCPVVRLISVTPHDERYIEYLYFYFKNLQYEEDGSAQQQATIPFFKSLDCVLFNESHLRNFSGLIKPFFDCIENNKSEIVELNNVLKYFLNFEGEVA